MTIQSIHFKFQDIDLLNNYAKLNHVLNIIKESSSDSGNKSETYLIS